MQQFFELGLSTQSFSICCSHKMTGKALHIEQFRVHSKHQICHTMGFSIHTPEISYILYKLYKSCGQLEPKLSKIEQFLASKIGFLSCASHSAQNSQRNTTGYFLSPTLHKFQT